MTAVIPPGSTIGVLGGGQLGRMTALAAAALGYRCHIFSPEKDAPAAHVADAQTVAAYTDRKALAKFAGQVAVVTYEFENIPHEPVAELAAKVPVRPSPDVLRITQDRLREKEFVNGVGVATTKYRPIANLAELMAGVEEIGRPAVLKTARMGYDGKGQVPIRADTDLARAWDSLAHAMPEPVQGILEGFVEFEREVSAIVARGLDGKTASYVAVENRHENHILAQTIAPARVPFESARRAEAVARHIAEKIGLVGIMGVEMFVGRDGGLLVNELAPRPHNSGHWTIDACVTSQFEQVVRAICGLPLGNPRRHSDAVMDNLIGEAVNRWPEILKDPDAKLHLYGKREVRPGRKMGHVTRLSPRKEEVPGG
ncbi:MAG TPA: 5-(carboxyamino)imidazole ribonucleotide synthase [Alphaproteobacteria bacterium]|nr:5-(carboxyamino)imidazole ribonucleotide synthase [Alphaproteobacteria bacterium]